MSARGRWTNTCRLSGATGESDLFSKLVCLISPAWCWKAEHASVIFQMQEISSDFPACEIGLCELKSLRLWAFSCSEWGQRGAGLAMGLFMPAGLSSSRMRLFCPMNWPLGWPWWWRICTSVTSGVGCQDTSAGGIAWVRMICPLAHEGVKMVIGHCCYPLQPPRVLGFLAGREPKLSSQLIKVERGTFWVRTDNFTASAISSTERFLLVRGNIFPNLCTETSGSLFTFLKSNEESMNFWGLD